MYLRFFAPFGFYIILKEGGTHLRVPTGLPPHRSFGPAATSNVVPGALVPDGYAVATHVVAHLLQRTVVCVCSKHGASCCKIALPIFLSCTVARVCKKHAISSPIVFLPIFLSRTVPFRPRRNVRAISLAIVQGSR